MCRCLVYYFRALRATMLFFGTSPLKKDKGQKTPAPSVGVALFPNMRDAYAYPVMLRDVRVSMLNFTAARYMIAETHNTTFTTIRCCRCS